MSRLEELSTFVAIARARSITKAAEHANIAKSAVSKKLSDLEQRLGVQLVERTTRRMTLTQAGETFLTRAEQILDDLAEAEAEAQAGAKSLSGRLRVAAPLSYSLTVLQPILSEFMLEHPDITLEIDFSDRRVDLIEEGFDMALRIGTLIDSSLIARKVTTIRHVAAASPAFWDHHGRPDKPEALTGLPCLRYRTGVGHRHIEFRSPNGEKRDISPNIRILASNGELLALMASDGLGYMVEPEFIIAPMIKKGALETVLEDYQWTHMDVSLVYPPSRKVSARARRFSAYVTDRLRQNNP